MKQKYLISRNDEKNKLTIKEFAELEKQDEYTARRHMEVRL